MSQPGLSIKQKSIYSSLVQQRFELDEYIPSKGILIVRRMTSTGCEHKTIYKSGRIVDRAMYVK